MHGWEWQCTARTLRLAQGSAVAGLAVGGSGDGGNGRQGTGTPAEAGTEAGHDKGPGLGHWMAHG